MLDYLARCDLLPPAEPPEGQRGHGIPRKYRFGDIVVLRALQHLAARGISVLRLRPSLLAIRPLHGSITTSKLPARYLVTSGESVSLVGTRQLVSALAEHGAAVVLLDLSALSSDLQDAIRATEEQSMAVDGEQASPRPTS